MLGYYVHDFDPFLIRFGENFGIRWYGFAYVLAFVTGFFLYRRLCRQGFCEMPDKLVGDFITGGALFGVLLGGRLGYALFYAPELLLDFSSKVPFWGVLAVNQGGMSSHGGMLGLVLFTLYFARRHKLSWTGIGDNLCVVAPVGLFFGRVANFINGELYGRPTDVPWAVIFPDEPEPRHPSQLYEAFLEGVVLFAVLWLVRTRVRVPRGVLTGLFFLLYALLRIVGEMYRVPDPAWAVGRMSAGQFLSLFLIVLGAIFIFYGWKSQHYEKKPEPK